MLKDRVLQLQFIKKNNKQPNPSVDGLPAYPVTPEQINKIVKDQVRHTAIVVGGLYAARVLLITASQIAINVAPKRY